MRHMRHRKNRRLTAKINVLMYDDVVAELFALADEMEVTASTIVRKAIDEYLEKIKGDENERDYPGREN